MKNKILNGYLKIDEPMKRETYFKYSICLILLQVILVLIFAGINFLIKVPAQFILLFIVFMIFVEIPILYMFFSLCSKRIWDLTKDKFISILACAIIFIISLYMPLIFAILFGVLAILPTPTREIQ